jgi:hypothetical protein
MSNAVSAMKLITAGAPGGAMSGVEPLTILAIFSTAVRVLPQPRRCAAAAGQVDPRSPTHT